MEKVNDIINDYLDLTEKEIDLIFELEEINRNIYNSFFDKKEKEIIALKNKGRFDFEITDITWDIYSFYKDEIRKYFTLGYAFARRND